MYTEPAAGKREDTKDLRGKNKTVQFLKSFENNLFILEKQDWKLSYNWNSVLFCQEKQQIGWQL